MMFAWNVIWRRTTMNKEEVNAVQFKFSTHLSLEHKHCTTYTAEYGGHMFGMCKHMPYKDGALLLANK